VVKVSAMVDASGAVLNAEVLVSSGHAALDQAALEAVRRALFAPALQGGEPVACRIVVPIRFQLTAAGQ
jgi:protein TonB